MARALAHRGPDDQGVWSDDGQGVALAHRRLAILDLSSAGHQPMFSASGRYVIAFNGEIYNHLELRRRLEERPSDSWRGSSDTETLLAGIDRWGLEETLVRSVGMFALAVWDRQERRLSLARDRIGEKPLYYGLHNGIFLFGSELKSLKVHPAFETEVDRRALSLLIRHNYIPAPFCIWANTWKLPPGTVLKVSAAQTSFDPRPYWSFSEAAVKVGSFQGSYDDAVSAVETCLSDAVRGQMLSDVPLGALLSGGVDSATVVALMQQHASTPVRTFSVGFSDKQFDESAQAQAVADQLGTDHTNVQMTPIDVLDLVPRLAELYDEPLADSSQLPTTLIMRVARQQVTVALSGDGGDELFGGYNRYRITQTLWDRMSRMPSALRRATGRVALSLPVGAWNGFSPLASPWLGDVKLGDKMHRLGSRLMQAERFDDLAVSLVSEWTDGGEPVLGSVLQAHVVNTPALWPPVADPTRRLMAADVLTYLPDDIMAKVDRASMSVSLETRAPFLDHRLVELAFSMPSDYLFRNGRGKSILRTILARRLPESWMDRPKMGFGIPLDRWLRTDLREWAENLLSTSVLTQGGFFDVAVIRRNWHQHLSGERNLGFRLWSVLVFQDWLGRQGEDVHRQAVRHPQLCELG